MPRTTPAIAVAATLASMPLAAHADQHQADGLHLPGVSATASLDYVSQYFFRGYEQLDSDMGLVIQPGVEFTLPVIDMNSSVVTATLGTWGSIHTEGSGWPVTPAPGSGPANPTSWFEQDIYGSLNFDAEAFDFSIGLTQYIFPSSASNVNITEASFTLTLNDEPWLGDYAFNPYVMLAVELQNNNVSLGRELSYLEIGGAFEFDMAEHYGTPLVWSVPIAVGISIDDYYVDSSLAEETFGFVSIGLFGTTPLSGLIGTDEYLGAWDLKAGVTLMLLNSDVNGQVDNTSGSGDNYQVYATVGISRDW